MRVCSCILEFLLTINLPYSGLAGAAVLALYDQFQTLAFGTVYKGGSG